MVRGLPAYEWWKNPPDEVLLRVYLFNVTNSERFESGVDKKLELNEIGPIVFRCENMQYYNILYYNITTVCNVPTIFFIVDKLLPRGKGIASAQLLLTYLISKNNNKKITAKNK